VDESAFRQVFAEHQHAVFRFAFRMTNSEREAEDIAQDTFLALLKHPERFEPSRGTMRTFLLGIARNLARKKWRDHKRWTELGDEEVVLPAPIPDQSVATAVQLLPPLQREVLILTHYEELSLDEVARTVGAEIGAVKARLHRARQNLKKALQ
jgi:RNA polymerase sigma-70 factor (ECF subfamily)